MLEAAILKLRTLILRYVQGCGYSPPRAAIGCWNCQQCLHDKVVRELSPPQRISMADYKTHITTSTVLGVGYGSLAFLAFDVPPAPCILAGGLCAVSGMLPDMDSASGTPVREGSAFAAAVIPMLMIDRFIHMGMTPEMMALIGGSVYVAIRFCLPFLLSKFSKHRGMWHSIPACAIAGLLAFMICSGEHLGIRIFKAGGVVLGFMSHLALDELWSIQVYRGRLRFKSSFGTAIKFFSKSPWANFSTYSKLAALSAIAIGDPVMMEQLNYHPPGQIEITQQQFQQTATEIQQSLETMFR